MAGAHCTSRSRSSAVDNGYNHSHRCPAARDRCLLHGLPMLKDFRLQIKNRPEAEIYRAFLNLANNSELGRAVSPDTIAQTINVAGRVGTRKINDVLIQDSPQHCRLRA